MAIAIIMAFSDGLKVEAQAFHRIYSGIDVNSLLWSPDGTRLSFNEGDDVLVSTATNVWHEYEPSTQTLTAPAQWPRQPDLTSEEIALYQPATQVYNITGTDEAYPSFIFSSPNDDYIVYASNIGINSKGYPVYIADRQNQIVAETHTAVWLPSAGLMGMNVIWNRTSTAFVVSATAPTSGEFGNRVIGYVGNFSTALTDLVMTSPDEMTIAGHHYWAAEAYSVSDNGDSVLVRAFDLNSATGSVTYELVVWNISTNTSTIIGDMDAKNIRTANFDNGDPDNVLIFNETGIVRYSVSTENTTIISTQINTNWDIAPGAMTTAFSSDGQWLAVVRSEGGLPSVYVFNILEDFIGLKVQYYPEVTTRSRYSGSIEGQFNIVNMSDVDIDLSDLTIRYFFSRDTAQPLQAACSWTALPNECDDVIVTTGTWTTVTVDSYMDIGFTAGLLAAHSETQDIIVHAIKQDYSDFDQSNDYSFDFTSNSDTFIDWDRVALYYNGKMVWGIEPY